MAGEDAHGSVHEESTGRGHSDAEEASLSEEGDPNRYGDSTHRLVLTL